MNVALSAAGVFGGFAIGSGLILMASTYATCEKMDMSVAFKDGAIAAAVPSIAYFLAAYFDFIRQPFLDFYTGFGVLEPWTTRVSLGHIVLIFLWPMMVWSMHDATTKSCVATVDEMNNFKKNLMAKLSAKQIKDAKTTATPPPK